MAISRPVQDIIEHGNRLFTDKEPLNIHCQELAEHFYYDRADFTGSLNIGDDFAAGSFTSRAAIYRRELGDSYRTFLRPPDFFEVKALDDDRNKRSDAREWLQYATKLQRSAMYRQGAFFTRATNIGDHDHVTFGQAVLDVCPTKERNALYYKAWHFRDVAWAEDYTGAISDIHRNETCDLINVVQLFGDKVPEKLRKDVGTTPRRKIKLRHVVVPSGSYDLGYTPRKGHDWASLWVMPEEGEVLENIGRAYRGYVIPRAATVSGSQYARSPFTSIILPDARTTQAIERILLEAGEKAIDPPMLGQLDVVRSDIGLYAGGITWLDAQYDERLGEGLRPINIDTSALPHGSDMAARFDMVIREGMMRNQISLPDTSGKTAYEVRKIVEQQMRAHIPIFEPVEVEYNEPLCAETFAVMRAMGAFPVDEIPQSLQNSSIEFSFKSPIKELEDDGMRHKFIEGMELLSVAAKVDPLVAKLPNAVEISKDLLRGTGWKESWINDEKALAKASEAMDAELQAQGQAEAVGGVAAAAGKAAPMVKAMADMGQAA
ncbi:MAG TPA: portal protein [Pseudaminobacter sp.]|nr:portal protein [Pseudaminobacter sp.]